MTRVDSRPPNRSAHPPRDLTGRGLAVLNRLAGLPVLDRLGLRAPMEQAVFQGTRLGFRTAGAATRRFAAVQQRVAPVRPTTAQPSSLFDLTPTDEQQMIRDAAREFGAKEFRPIAGDADSACAAPADLLERISDELGTSGLVIPEAFGGFGSERSVVTGVLVAEALAHGDLSLAVAALAPAAVATALVLWGDERQQATYLPAFAAEHGPAAALAVIEPSALFDPFRLSTTATRQGDGYRLSGTKSLVPAAAAAELFVIAASLDGAPGLFLVESDSAGLTVEPEPAMGLRAAATGRVRLTDVTVSAGARLGTAADYTACVRLSRIAWSALAVGTAQAVLDYVIPYVNDRVAFGEPVSHRQSVAFMVADIAIELEGMRLATYRAASRAERGADHARETALARRLTTEYGMRIGSNGVQLLGGHGYVKEHPVERWYRDLRAAGLMEGTVLV